MKKIRLNTFETNSSSTHSMVIAPEDEFSRWERGEVYYHDWKDKFATKEEILEELKNDIERYRGTTLATYLSYETPEERKEYAEEVLAYEYEEDFIEDTLRDFDWYTYDNYTDTYYLEVETTHYTTPGGENLTILCKYGYDG